MAKKQSSTRIKAIPAVTAAPAPTSRRRSRASTTFNPAQITDPVDLEWTRLCDEAPEFRAVG